MAKTGGERQMGNAMENGQLASENGQADFQREAALHWRRFPGDAGTATGTIFDISVVMLKSRRVD
jgi:hypothetical protein